MKQRKRGMGRVVGFAAVMMVAAMVGLSGAGARESEAPTGFDIAVFVPGVTAGSPVYEQLVAGTERAAAAYDHVTVKVLEAGFNQGEWEGKLTALAAEEKYELIISANGAMPYVALPVTEAFPEQKFLILDAIIEHPQMHTILYNQVEQGYMIGYLAGLITTSAMERANEELKIGMLAGQEYPAMNDMIQPGYEKGAKAVDPRIEMDFRVLGNWFDANKAGELAKSMINAGADIILAIAGGANQGVISVAEDLGAYVLYFDEDSYDIAPGTIVGSTELHQERAAYEAVTAAIEGDLAYGETEIFSTADGYVDFVDTNPLYAQSVSPEVRAEMALLLDRMRSGDLALEIPVYWK